MSAYLKSARGNFYPISAYTWLQLRGLATAGHDHIRRMVEEGFLSQETANLTIKAVDTLYAATGMRRGAGCCGDGTYLFCWDEGAHHFELETSSDEPPFLFYMNHETKESWSEKWNDVTTFPPEALKYTNFFK